MSGGSGTLFGTIVAGNAHHGIAGDALEHIAQFATHGLLHSQQIRTHILKIGMKLGTPVLPRIAPVTVRYKYIAQRHIVGHDAPLGSGSCPWGGIRHRHEQHHKDSFQKMSHLTSTLRTLFLPFTT